MWKGRFSKPTADLVQRYGESVSYDWRLFRQDIAGSIAHARAQLKAGLLNREEFDAIESGLKDILKDIEEGNFTWSRELEDVHMNIESELTRRIGAPGAKLHTKVEIQKDQLCLTVTTDRFARLVHLESSRTSLPFSDNYFDLLPGQSHTVTLAADPDCTLRELAESIRVKSLSDVPFDRDPLHAAAKRIKVYLSPVNIGNAIHHGKLSKDIEL